MKRHHPRSGFTLIELLIALVLTGLVGALVLDFVMAQGRFGARQAAVQEVQQNARGALELIVSELRGVPPGSVESVGGADDELSFRRPLAWGVVCVAQNTATPVVSFPPGAMPDPLPTGWGLDLPDPDPASPPNGRIFVSGVGDPTSGATCGEGGDGGELWSVPLTGAVTAAVGTAVFVYERISYDVSDRPEAWLRRNTQPLAGPVREFRVLYNPASGASSTSSATDVSRVEVKVSAESRSQVQNGGPVVETDSMVVFLRNRS